MLQGKNIILAVSGSIAAYKAAFITRLLITSGATVKVVMTDDAEHFITSLTLGTLSKNPVLKDFTKNEETGEWNNHVDLGLWADLMLVAPATANTMAKMATGHADSFLLATYLSARCPVFIAPAMDLDMYKHGSTQDNIASLLSRGNTIIYPEEGELASGLEGQGRLAEPEHIIEQLNEYFSIQLPLNGKRILITAGPTHEPIDPVRFIGNRSSGKMGFALAAVAVQRGAKVTLISGPVGAGLKPPKGLEKYVAVESAEDMFTACKAHFIQDAVIMSAAVADYTPLQVASEKIKKKNESWDISLSKTKDILKWMGETKEEQILFGFALETTNELENAKAKLKNKNLDAIVLNSLNNKGAGFEYDTNQITILDKHNNMDSFELKSKAEVAEDILDKLESFLPKKNT